ncbi:Protein GLUTAMINE DUMPER 2 [Linum grandiflorum]
MEATSQPIGLTTAEPSTSPWHSPVPYLFGGLAAMLGLIGFALLILACSYWKLSGQIENGGDSDQRDLEAGEETEDGEKKGKKQQYEEKVLVIMAGQVNPTFLATLSSSRTSSFGDAGGSEKTCRCGEKLDGEKQGNSVEEEEQSGNRGVLGNDELPPTSAAAEEVAVDVAVAVADDTTSHQ